MGGKRINKGLAHQEQDFSQSFFIIIHLLCDALSNTLKCSGRNGKDGKGFRAGLQCQGTTSKN